MLKTNPDQVRHWQEKSRRPLNRGKRINPIGPRTRKWLKIAAWLRPRVKAAGRGERCEFGFIHHECWGQIFPCHSKKRRNCSDYDLHVVAYGCEIISGWLDEKMSHADMEQAVWRAINENGGLIVPEELAAARFTHRCSGKSDSRNHSSLCERSAAFHNRRKPQASVLTN